MSMFEQFIKLIPADLLHSSGSVFYSGRDAFQKDRPVYLLGLNPGGNVETQADETVEKQAKAVLHEQPNWSAYKHEVWEKGKEPGGYGLQPRVLHLLKSVDLDPGEVPSCNLIFLRSQGQKDIKAEFAELADLCWPFHKAVLELIQPKVIVCFGQLAGGYVRNQLDASELVDKEVERNNRGWTSWLYQNSEGLMVLVATHPSRADWTAPETDPSRLLKRALSA